MEQPTPQNSKAINTLIQESFSTFNKILDKFPNLPVNFAIPCMWFILVMPVLILFSVFSAWFGHMYIFEQCFLAIVCVVCVFTIISLVYLFLYKLKK